MMPVVVIIIVLITTKELGGTGIVMNLAWTVCTSVQVNTETTPE